MKKWIIALLIVSVAIACGIACEHHFSNAKGYEIVSPGPNRWLPL